MHAGNRVCQCMLAMTKKVGVEVSSEYSGNKGGSEDIWTDCAQHQSI